MYISSSAFAEGRGRGSYNSHKGKKLSREMEERDERIDKEKERRALDANLNTWGS